MEDFSNDYSLFKFNDDMKKDEKVKLPELTVHSYIIVDAMNKVQKTDNGSTGDPGYTWVG